MKEEIKQKYIEIIDSLGYETPILESAKDFIRSYTGADIPEFHKFMLETLALIIHTGELEVRADAYDEIEATRKQHTEKLKKVAVETETEVDQLSIPTPA